MPELPEMETYKILLHDAVVGKTITDVVVGREKSINVPATEFIQHVKNEKISKIERRAKQLIFHLQNESYLLLHLMLGGWMFYGTETEKPDRTVQIEFSFGTNRLYFIGLRLGYLHLYSEQEIQTKLEKNGPEPLHINFSINDFLKKLHGKRGNLKTTLMDQTCIAGIGNRYSDEIAWHAELLPHKKINDLGENDKIRLYHSIRFILQRGINTGGYMEHPFSTTSSKLGGYQMYVHNREGEPCPRCQGIIVMEKIAGHKAYFCGNCQH